jgi:trehalose-6-phosphatase
LDLDFVLVVGDERTDEDMFDVLQVGRKGGREGGREESREG